MTRTRGISIRALKQRAETVRQSVMAAKAATAEELAAQQPGGALNPDRSAEAWLLWLIRLHRLDAHALGAASGGGRTSEDAGVLAALISDPVPVALSRQADDQPVTLLVRPLSFVALAELDKRDVILSWLATHTAACGSGSTEDLDLYARAADEAVYQQRVCASIVTADTAPRLYFDPLVTPRPEPAAITAEIDPVDFLRIMRAHAEVNMWRLQAITPLLSKQHAERSNSGWGTFFATLERDRGEPSAHYLHDAGLVPLVTARVAAAAAEREALEQARQKAEREAKQKRGGRSPRAA